MKISLPCMECFRELGYPSLEFINADYYDDMVAHIRCKRGHTSSVVLQSQKFEVLLESATNALIEDYTTEAVFAFYSAYERFLEFCIRVICDKREVEKLEFEENFKQIARQSERQLGGFLILHLIEFGKNYKIQNKITDLRNKVVHKGHIPTPEEAREFAEIIYGEIYSLTQLLKKDCDRNIQNIISEDLQRRWSKIDPTTPKSTSTGVSLFSLSCSIQKSNFSEAFDSYKKSRQIMSQLNPSTTNTTKQLTQ